MKHLNLINIFFIYSILTVTFSAPSLRKSQPQLPAVNNLDLRKYTGYWYEIAKLPSSNERHCFCSTTRYDLTSKGTVTVKNSCNWECPEGNLKEAYGEISPVNKVEKTITTGNFDFSLSWLPLLHSSYIVIDIDEDYYHFAMVGSADKEHLWILSRTPDLNEKIYAHLIDYAKELGFDVSKIIPTYHGEDCEYSYI